MEHTRQEYQVFPGIPSFPSLTLREHQCPSASAHLTVKHKTKSFPHPTAALLRQFYMPGKKSLKEEFDKRKKKTSEANRKANIKRNGGGEKQ